MKKGDFWTYAKMHRHEGMWHMRRTAILSQGT